MNFQARTQEMVAFLRQLVEAESPTNEKKAVDQVAAILAEASRRSGAKLTFFPQKKVGDHFLAEWGSSSKGKGILLLGHMDTVFPLGTLKNMPFYTKGEKVFGPGVLDMKGGLAIALTAIAALQESDSLPNRPISMLFTADEETGSLTSRALIEKFAAHADLVLVLESALSDGSLKTWRKGTGDFRLRVQGRAAHAGSAHAEGRNAIEELAHQVLAIQALTDYEKGTTLNIGKIRGGTASNVVPEFAEAEIDLRIMQTEEYGRVDAALRALQPALQGTSLSLRGELNRPPMPFDATMQKTFEKAQNIARKEGISLKAGGSGGASDANFVAPLGIPVLDGLGAVGEGLHSSREYIFTKSLPEKARLLASLLKNW
jgi:glutamate carboxypeptidase